MQALSHIGKLGREAGGFYWLRVVFWHMDGQTLLGQTVATLRREQNLKLVAVSKKLSASTIHAIERGVLVPSPRILDLLTTAFNCMRKIAPTLRREPVGVRCTRV